MRQLTVSAWWDSDPAWSPDGTRNTFSGRDYEINTMQADGTSLHQLTTNGVQFPEHALAN